MMSVCVSASCAVIQNWQEVLELQCRDGGTFRRGAAARHSGAPHTAAHAFVVASPFLRSSACPLNDPHFNVQAPARAAFVTAAARPTAAAAAARRARSLVTTAAAGDAAAAGSEREQQAGGSTVQGTGQLMASLL